VAKRKEEKDERNVVSFVDIYIYYSIKRGYYCIYILYLYNNFQFLLLLCREQLLYVVIFS